MEASQVVPVTEEDADDVISMLKKSFFLHETLNASIGLVDADGNCPELEQYCRASIPTGLSLQARDTDSKEIIGVMLNSVLERGGGQEEGSYELRPDSTKFEKVLAINHEAELLGDVFQAFPEADRALDIMVLATHPAHLKKGIARSLTERSIDLARSLRLPLVRCICSGAFSARVVERLGFTQLGMKRYADFLGLDGQPVFRPPPPHEGVSVWALALPLAT